MVKCDWLQEKDMNMVLTDDVDSVIAANLLQQELGWKVSHFYDFNKLLVSPHMFYGDEDKLVGIDLTLAGQKKTIDNHVFRWHGEHDYNKQCINFNSHIKAMYNYTNKCLFNTVLHCYYLLGKKLPSNNVGKAILLLIDSTYYGWIKKDFRSRLVQYLEEYGFTELIDILNKVTPEQWKQLEDYFKIKRKIKLDDRLKFIDVYSIEEFGFKYKKIFDYLELKEELELPTYFELDKKMRTCHVQGDNLAWILNLDNLYSYSIVRKRECKYSVIFCDEQKAV
ncbi:MAG: hypothetical protein PWQ70_2200 [Clostridiales bacterium]|nr:hypothetical protein [Clostridiales bacterium]